MFTRDRGPVNFVTTIGIKLDIAEKFKSKTLGKT